MSDIKNMLIDTITLMHEESIELKNESCRDPNDLYLRGQLFGYYRAIHLIQTQIKAFQIDELINKIGEFDYEEELLGLKKPR